MDFEEHEVRLRTGTCPSCAKEFAFVEGATVSSRLGSPPSLDASPSEGEPEADERAFSGLECDECGSPLSLQAGDQGSLVVTCEECDTTKIFVPKTEGARHGREPAPRSEEGPPRGRPCRRCGAPLRFSTGEDGLLVGECASCGNRFTLPPRPDRGGGGRGYGRSPRGDQQGFPRGPRDRARYGRGRPFRRTDRREPSRYDTSDRPRKRRRPRDE